MEIVNENERNIELAPKEDLKVSGWGYRHLQCLIHLMTLTIAQSMRVCMGIAMVAMVDRADIDEVHVKYDYNKTNESGMFIVNETIVQTIVNDTGGYKAEGFLNFFMLTPPYPKFEWNTRIQNILIASFFWGYVVLQVPGGQLARRFSPTLLLIVAMATNCVISILYPLVTYYGNWHISVVCRVIQGLTQGCIIPSIHTCLGKWAPLEERGRMTAIIYGGQALGSVVGIIITGFIAASSMGWPGIFRFYGTLSGISACALWWLSADSPAKHRKISATERRYIEEALRQTDQSKVRPPVPWRKILRHRGLWGIVMSHIGACWGHVMIFAEMPAYMKYMMGVNIEANGMLTAFPFFVMWLTNFFFSWFYDMLVVKEYLGVSSTRKLADFVGSFPSCVGFIVLAYAPKNLYMVEAMLIVFCGFKISSQNGFFVNVIDISPNFSGTIMSISNLIANLFGSCFAPVYAGLILTDITSEHLWRIVFLTTSGVYFFTNLLYVVFGTAELADWNDPPTESDEEKAEEEKSMVQDAKLENK